MSRSLPFELSNVSELPVARYKREPGAVAARVVIANGSPLIGQAQAALAASSSGAVTCIGMGPRGAKERLPLSNLRLQSGDQLFLDGLPDDIATFATKNRLLEIDRADTAPVDARKSILALSFFLLALSAILLWRLPPALPFLLAATAMAGFKLIPSREVYTSVDWSIIVLLAAMIPVGQSFESTGAAAKVAEFLAGWLVGSPLYLIIAAISGLTLILTILLNNVATALVMGPLSIQLAETLHVPVDPLLLAVLVGASADFLTPIGHQNNLLVMRPGGYKFTDYARAGFLLSVVVIVVTTGYLSIVYGQSR